jgi:hypothetical protein
VRFEVPNLWRIRPKVIGAASGRVDLYFVVGPKMAVDEGKPAPLIQAALGHSSLSTTDRYLRHIAPAELIESLSSREWSL